MDGSNDPGFQSVVILGLKTALLEAQDEISRITKERDEARKKILQMIQTNGKYQVEVINSNELATKLKTELKKVRKELEAHKKELEKQKIDLENAQRQKENENYNWKFQYEQLKSLLDIKTELLESLNVKGDKVNKDDLIDYRANYRIIMKNLKMVVKNQPCYPDHELLEDIRNIIYRIESGRSVSLSKYLAKKVKPVKKEIEKCNDNFNIDVHEDSRIHSYDPDSVNDFSNRNHNSSENRIPNVAHNMKMDDFFELDKSISKNTNFVADKTNTVLDKPKTNVCITDMPDLLDETVGGVVSAEPSDKKNMDTISDSESDSTSGFCDGETEAESPPSSMEFVNQPSNVPENHTFAMCMPDLLPSSDTEKNSFGFCENSHDNASKSSISVSNSNLKSRKSPSPQKKKLDSKNELPVMKILEEMKNMKITMTDQVSVLKQYYDENLDELNSCFKRPESVLPSRRKYVSKNNIENVTNIIPKRSSQLVKRDPCSRKVNASVTDFNDDEIREMRLDSGSPSDPNAVAMDSPAKSNLDCEANESRAVEKRDVDEIRSGNSSLSADVTNNFDIATEPLSRLLTEASFCDTIDLKNTSDDIMNVLSTDDVATAVETKNTRISQLPESIDEINNSSIAPQTDVPENSNLETLPQITLKSNVCNSAESSSTNRSPNDATVEESGAVFKPSLGNISSQIMNFASSSNVEKLDKVSTRESHAVTAFCGDIVSLGADVSNDRLISTSTVLNRKPVNESLKSPNTEKALRKNRRADLVNEKRPQKDVTIENTKTAFQKRLDNISSSNVENPPEDSSKERDPVADPMVVEQLTSTLYVSNRKSIEKSSKPRETEKMKTNNHLADIVNEKQPLSSSSVENSREVPTEDSNTVPDPGTGIVSLVTDESNEQPLAANISNRNLDKKSSKSRKTAKTIRKNDNSDLVNEKPVEGTLKKKRNAGKSAKSKQVSFSNDEPTQSTREENNVMMANLLSSYEAVISEVASSYVQEAMEESQVSIVSVPASDVDSTPDSCSADGANEDGPAKVSTATQQFIDSSDLAPKTNTVILDGSNESSTPKNNSAIDSNTIDEKIMVVQNEDNLAVANSETEQSTNSSTVSRNENATILEHPEKSPVPENNTKSNSTDDSNLTVEKTTEDVPKKRGRLKKASCDAPDKTKTAAQKTVSIFEHSNVSSVLENNTKYDSVDDSQIIKEETSQPVIKKRGRPRKTSLDSQHSSNQSANASPAKGKRNGAVLRKPAKSSVLKNNVESETTDAAAAEMVLRSSTQKRKCGRPKKAPPSAPKPQLQNATKRDSDNLETAHVSRRKCAAEASKKVAENSEPSYTMNNGMERRKRKGKFVEIIGSLKCKPKRRKSDYDAVSLEPTDDVKPQQRRGRKRKASLPIETFESATQTNWSPNSKSKTSRDVESIHELKTDEDSEPKDGVDLAETSSKIIHNDQQIEEQTLPSNTNKNDTALNKNSFKATSTETKKPEIPTALKDESIAADFSLLPSSHLLSSSAFPFPQFLEDVSKIIQERVLSILLAKSSQITGENPTKAVELKKLPHGSLPNVDQRELIPVSVEAGFVHDPSSVPTNNVESDALSSVQTSDDSDITILAEKSNSECTIKHLDSSNEPKDDQESIFKSKRTDTNQPKEITAAKLAQNCVPKSSDSSSVSKSDTESDEKFSAKTADRVISVEELKKSESPDLPKSENDAESVSVSSLEITDQSDVICSEKSKSESKLDEKSSTAQSTYQSKTIPASNLKEESISKTSNLENDEESVEKQVQFTNRAADISTTKSEQTNVTSSTSKPESSTAPCTTKSIFDCEADESPTKAVRKKVSFSIPEVSDERCDSPASVIDSDDDAPIEISSKITIPAWHTRSNADESSHLVEHGRENEPISRMCCEEEASNSSALSSQVSELDVNVELVSQFEGIRTPPKIKDLFDSSDDENSKIDVFNIIEEMTSERQSLLQRQKELAEFSMRSPPLIESAVKPSPTKFQTYSPSRNTVAECQSLYSPSQNNLIDGTQSKDEDDSEDETWVIAEDDLVTDGNTDGIEINKLNCNDTNHGCASPAYTKSLKPSNASYNFVSTQNTNFNTRPGLNGQLSEPVSQRKIVSESPAGPSNPIKFQFYKENVELENQGGTSKALSPFETVWQSLKSLYVRSADIDEDVELISCDHQSVAQKAFFFKNQKLYVNRWNSGVENDKMANVEKSIEKFLEYVRGNKYVHVKDFTDSEEWTLANSVTIASVLTSMVMKGSNRPMREIKETLGHLSNLSIELETIHAGFVALLQTTLKDKMFSKTWKVDNNSGTNQVSCIIAMSVLFTMLSQRSNDVKSVKDLLFEGLCSWKYRGHPIAFGVLNACPTIFNDASRNCLLTQIILFTLINHSMERNLDLYKVPEVREMIGHHYKVRLGDKAAEDHVKEAMLLFNDDTWVDAMVLLCKRKQFSWSYTNVIMKYFIQIVNKWKEEDFNEMILIKTIQALHKIVQCCPFKAVISSNKTKKKMPADSKYPMYNIGSIIKSLSEVLHCEKGSRELRETVAIAICNISHLDFEVCLNILSNWEPPECAISDKALEEMNVIMRRCRISDSYVPNKWEQTFSPKKANRRTNNFVPRRFNGAGGGDSTTYQQQRQHQPPIPKFHEKNSAFSEPPKKKKKKKNKGKKNRDNREQTLSCNSV